MTKLEAFAKFQNHMINVGERLLKGDRPLAEDFAQNIFLNLTRSGGADRIDDKKARAYMLTAMRNAYRDYLRRAKKQPVLLTQTQWAFIPTVEPTIEDKIDEVRMGSELRRALEKARLTKQERQVIHLYFVERWEGTRIALALGVTESRVRAIRGRSLEKVAAEFNVRPPAPFAS